MTTIVVGTAGHIDHGKSTLVHALTGIDPDRLKEEKARGITIELGFAHAAVGDTRIAFVDVPGHERFVRTMLAGVGGIDCVLLIVACDESVMPQTREHFEICRLLRVPQGVVVLTKSDAADPDMRELVRDEVRELVHGSFLDGAPMIEVSARTGAGLDALRAALVAAATRVGARPSGGATRLPVDRAFSMRGFGTVVTGTLVSGRVREGDELVLLPSGRAVKVRGVQVHGTAAAAAGAGQRTAINLGGIEVADVGRGQTLAPPGTLCVTRRADAAIELLAAAKPLKHGARVRVHQGTSEVLGRVSLAGVATEIPAGGRALVRLRLESVAALTRGDRFIVRAYSPPLTIGGGQVLDPQPTRPGIRSADGLAALRALELAAGVAATDDLAAFEAMALANDLSGMPVGELTARGGVRPGSLQATITALLRRGTLVQAGDRLIASAPLERAGDALVRLVTAFHRANPLSDGVSREEARVRVFARAAPAAFEWVVQKLATAGVMASTDRLALAGHRVAVSGEEARVKAAIAGAYLASGLKPPDSAGIAAVCQAAGPVIDQMTGLLVREKVLVRVDTLIFHADALKRLKAELTALKATAPGVATVDVAAFKDRYGVSRKFAIPLLEYLDRERVTRRAGDARLIL